MAPLWCTRLISGSLYVQAANQVRELQMAAGLVVGVALKAVVQAEQTDNLGFGIWDLGHRLRIN